MHDITNLIIPVVRSRIRRHERRLVPDQDDLGPGRDHGRIHDAAELGGAETGAVDDDGGGAARVVQRGGVDDVREHGSAEDDAGGQAAGDEPWEVDGGVDADGGEG